MELLSAARSSGRKSEGGSEREMAAMEGELRARTHWVPRAWEVGGCTYH